MHSTGTKWPLSVVELTEGMVAPSAVADKPEHVPVRLVCCA